MDLVTFFTHIFYHSTQWFNSVFSSTGMAQWLFAAVGVVMAIRFFIVPLFGSMFSVDSDKASDRFYKGKGL